MKTLKKNLLMLVMVMTAFVSFGNAKYGLENNIIVLNKSQLKIEFKNVKKGEVLTVVSEDGLQLYAETIKSDGTFVKVLDVSNLQNGDYRIELEKDFQIIVNELTIENQSVTYKKTKERTIFKPVIRNKENLLLISKIAFDKEPLKVAIYFDDEVIYTNTITEDTLIEKAYRLEKNIKGAYKVVVYNDNRNYTHHFKI